MRLLESIVIEQNGQLLQIAEGTKLIDNDLHEFVKSINYWEKQLLNEGIADFFSKGAGTLANAATSDTAKDIGAGIGNVISQIMDMGWKGLTKLVPAAMGGFSKIVGQIGNSGAELLNRATDTLLEKGLGKWVHKKFGKTKLLNRSTADIIKMIAKIFVWMLVHSYGMPAVLTYYGIQLAMKYDSGKLGSFLVKKKKTIINRIQKKIEAGEEPDDSEEDWDSIYDKVDQVFGDQDSDGDGKPDKQQLYDDVKKTVESWGISPKWKKELWLTAFKLIAGEFLAVGSDSHEFIGSLSDGADTITDVGAQPDLDVFDKAKELGIGVDNDQ
jgi:hypothetical protein